MARGQRDEPFAPGGEERAGTDKQRTGPALRERRKGGVDLAVVLASRMMSCSPRVSAAACTSFAPPRYLDCLGFTSTAIADALGTSSRSSSRRFCPNPASKVTPVTLPPGRLRLATRPCLTGSLPVTKTIGIVVVAALAASAAPAFATITATGRRTNRPPAPAAGRIALPPSGIRSRRSGPRRSPASVKALAERGHEVRASASDRAVEEADHRHRRLLRAHAKRPRAAAPPRSVMNSRRFIRSPRRRARAARRHVEAERLGGLEVDDELESWSAASPAGRPASRP